MSSTHRHWEWTGFISLLLSAFILGSDHCSICISVSVSFWSVAGKSQQKTVHWDDKGCVWDSCQKVAPPKIPAVTSVAVRRTPMCSFLLLRCLFLTHRLTPSASLGRNSSAEAPPTVCVSNQWSAAKTRGCFLPSPSLPHLFFLLSSVW